MNMITKINSLTLNKRLLLDLLNNLTKFDKIISKWLCKDTMLYNAEQEKQNDLYEKWRRKNEQIRVGCSKKG